MKLLKIKVLNGPNYWSNHRKKLIVLLLDLENHGNTYSNLIPNFNQRLCNLLPSLEEHRCFSEFRGGFFLKFAGLDAKRGRRMPFGRIGLGNRVAFAFFGNHVK